MKRITESDTVKFNSIFSNLRFLSGTFSSMNSLLLKRILFVKQMKSEIVSREAREKLNKPSHLEKCNKMGIILFKQENLESM